MLLVKLPVPVKVAVIEWLPEASALVANVAVPAETATFEASVVAPSVNVTEPVGVPALLETVAVRVTD